MPDLSRRSFGLAAAGLTLAFGAAAGPRPQAQPIDEGMFVDINGQPQWVTVRGRDRANPVLLWLHGGPGIAMSGQAPLFASWEKDFTIVQWDQPGGGATYARNGPEGQGELSIARYVRDATAVAEWACRHLGCRKLVVMGTSWGTLLGVELAHRRPDLVSVYVGAAQVVDGARGTRIGWEAALASARGRGDQAAIAELEKVGPGPYDRFEDFIAHQKYVNPPGQKSSPEEAAAIAAAGKLLAAPAPADARYVARDLPKTDGLKGFLDTQRAMFKPTAAWRAEDLGLEFEAPMVFFQGSDDLNTPTQLVREYAAKIHAPVKRLEIVPGAGHLVVVFHDQLLALLDQDVRPLALRWAPGRRG